MKVAISIPNAVFVEAERLAEKLGKSRSELYAEAVAEYVAEHRDELITAQLDAVYGQEPSTLDPVLDALQSEIFDPEGW